MYAIRSYYAITNVAQIVAVDQNDPVPGNDQASQGLVVTSADLAVAMTVSNPIPTEGDTVSFAVVLHNLGPHDAGTIQVADSLPAGLSRITSYNVCYTKLLRASW